MTVLALSAAALVGCADDPEEDPASSDPEPTSTPTPSSTPGSATASETPYLPVPDGIELTAQGSELALGETAEVG